jgi:hypothetical protein
VRQSKRPTSHQEVMIMPVAVSCSTIILRFIISQSKSALQKVKNIVCYLG